MSAEKDKNVWRELAAQGEGDDVIHDQKGDSWVVFRIDNPYLAPYSKYRIMVKQDGAAYTDVKAENGWR